MAASKILVMYTSYYKKVVLTLMVVFVAVSSFSQPGSLKTGDNVPAFKVTSLDDGSEISPSSLKGKVYLVDFWATWCAPCIKEMPRLHKLYSEYKDKGFTIVSLSFDQTGAAVNNFRKKKFPMPWSNGFVEGGLESAIATSFNVTGLPAVILVGKDGKIIGMNKELEGEQLEALLADALK